MTPLLRLAESKPFRFFGENRPITHTLYFNIIVIKQAPEVFHQDSRAPIFSMGKSA